MTNVEVEGSLYSIILKQNIRILNNFTPDSEKSNILEKKKRFLTQQTMVDTEVSG